MLTTIPEPCNPINAINSPIPAVTAYFMFLGIAFTTASRTLNNDKRIKMIPSTNTAVKAISQGILFCPTTVNAKYAFSPIPDANANGKLAKTPIKIVDKPAAKQVAVTKAPASIPAALKILGFTAMI